MDITEQEREELIRAMTECAKTGAGGTSMPARYGPLSSPRQDIANCPPFTAHFGFTCSGRRTAVDYSILTAIMAGTVLLLGLIWYMAAKRETPEAKAERFAQLRREAEAIMARPDAGTDELVQAEAKFREIKDSEAAGQVRDRLTKMYRERNDQFHEREAQRVREARARQEIKERQRQLAPARVALAPFAAIGIAAGVAKRAYDATVHAGREPDEDDPPAT